MLRYPYDTKIPKEFDVCSKKIYANDRACNKTMFSSGNTCNTIMHARDRTCNKTMNVSNNACNKTMQASSNACNKTVQASDNVCNKIMQASDNACDELKRTILAGFHNGAIIQQIEAKIGELCQQFLPYPFAVGGLVGVEVFQEDLGWHTCS